MVDDTLSISPLNGHQATTHKLTCQKEIGLEINDTEEIYPKVLFLLIKN